MDSAVLRPIGVYIKRRQTNIVERGAFWPIYALFVEAETMPGTSRMVRWLDQDAVNEQEE